MSFFFSLVVSAIAALGLGPSPGEAHGGIFMGPADAHGGIFGVKKP